MNFHIHIDYLEKQDQVFHQSTIVIEVVLDYPIEPRILVTKQLNY